MTTVQELSGLPPYEWPASAHDTILQALSSSEVETRTTAVELAGDPAVVDDTLARALLELATTSSGPEELRAMAAIALGPALDVCDTLGYEDDEDDDGTGEEPCLSQAMFAAVVAGLRALHDDEGAPGLVRRKALEASIRAPQPWQEGAIARGFASDDHDWRVTAVFCMGHVGGFDDEILQALTSADEDIVFEAARAAGQQGIEAAAPVLVRLARAAGEVTTRLAAIEALVYVPGDEVDDVLTVLSTDDDEDIAEAAESAMLERDAFGADPHDES